MEVNLPYTEKLLKDYDVSISHSTLSSTFGDGYTQKVPEGLNSKKETWKLTWGGLLPGEKDSLLNVLDGVGVGDILLWIPLYESVEKRFKLAQNYTFSTKNFTHYSVTCSLERIY